MPNANYRVNVYWEAVPYSDSYYRLSDQDKLQVNALLVNQVNALIPAQQQQNWRDLFFPSANYESILLGVNAMLMAQVVPPANKQLVLAEPQSAYWKPTTLGHQILFFANLKDSSGGTITPWEIVVTHNGVSHNARMGLTYVCALA